MKKLLFFPALLLTLLLVQCNSPVNDPFEGSWDMQYAEWSLPDTTFTFTKTDAKQQVKIFENGHFVWLQQDIHADSSNKDLTAGGFGTYIVSGDTIFEVLVLSPWPDVHGKSYSSKIEVRGDSLIQVFPYPGHEPEIWKEWKGKEIYIRIK
jgi:hypothetical protein